VLIYYISKSSVFEDIIEMTANERKILVCIPAFNESMCIADVIRAAKRYATEVLVCDDGSVDGTGRVAEEAGAGVIRHNRNMGYGAGIKTLFKAARDRNPDVMVTLDSDGQHDPEMIPKVIKPILHDGFDLVIGSRFLTNSDREHVPALRRIGIKIITSMVRGISYKDITDAQSGFRAYSKEALSKIELFEKGMSVSTEILIKAKGKNLKMTEIPLTINYNIANGSTHNPVSHGMNVIYSILQFIIVKHPLLFYGLPGLVLITVSALYINQALELFSATRYVSTPLILLSVGSATIGIIMLITATLIYAMKTMMSGKID
jgi:glycosyltransferase involved in cell wall biosynthesis